jgi:tetratricopeptide (TPR) repeat protein
VPSGHGRARSASAEPPSAETGRGATSLDRARAQARKRPSKRLLPEDHLARAMAAKSSQARAKWAGKGLAQRSLDPTTHAMLLRQLYLAHFADGRYAEGYEIAAQAATLGVLPDVIHQDMARLKHADGDTEAAVGHLRLAARLGPPSRRAFHWWTLGSLLFTAKRHDEAIAALQRAARWGTTDKPLYQGHLALAKCRAGQRVRGLRGVMDRLASCPAGQGYGRFVLGHLAFEAERFDEARRYLEAFVERASSADRRPLAVALAAEVEMARETLARLDPAS